VSPFVAGDTIQSTWALKTCGYTERAMGNPFIHIRSEQFPILPGEEEELVNEGMYGKALVTYLQEHLTDRGYESPFVCC